MKKALGLLLLLFSTVTFAADVTVATIADNVVTEIDGIPDLFAAFSYVCGIILGIKALLKFKEHNESKGQVKLSTAILFFVAAGMFLGLPTILNIGYDTMGYRAIKQNNSYNYSKETY